MSSYDRPSRPQRQKRRSFGVSWWGNAWVEAVEQLADLNQSRLARGRTYARWNYVGALTVEPGVIRARVAGSRATPYHTYVKVSAFTDVEWRALLDVVAGKVAHAAALIDSELTSELVDDARDVGIELLPGPGDLTTGCTCPDDVDPCKHAAAVCYLFADLLDDDPFALLHIRGRTQAEVSNGLRERRRLTATTKGARTIAADDEVIAKAVFAEQQRGPLPHVPKAPQHPGTPASVVAEFASSDEVDVHDLEILAQAAAQRAWEMCTGIGNSGLKESSYLDLVRRLAPLLGTPEFDVACSHSRRIKSSVEQDARLWIKGGLLALREADVIWHPEPEVLAPAVQLLQADGPVDVRNNRVTCSAANRQLRLGESGQWYEFHQRGTQWLFVDLVDLS